MAGNVILKRMEVEEKEDLGSDHNLLWCVVVQSW